MMGLTQGSTNRLKMNKEGKNGKWREGTLARYTPRNWISAEEDN